MQRMAGRRLWQVEAGSIVRRCFFQGGGWRGSAWLMVSVYTELVDCCCVSAVVESCLH